jgi:DNA-binding beta-propeller fold protein YncE
MRRLFLLAVLLLIPAAHAATGPTNGCPAPCSGQVSSPEGTQFLYVQPAGVGGAVHAYDPDSGVRLFSLPRGVTSADGGSHVNARMRLRDTVVSRYRVADGSLVDWMVVAGRWRLGGVSPNGRFAALARQSSDRRRTDVAVVNTVSQRVAHRLRLRGNFEVETVSRDGKRLFLIEHLPGTGAPRYSVRLFDLSRDRLASKPLRGAGEPGVMAGLAWSGIGSPDGRWLLTLYLNTGRNVAFVHALDLVRSSPLCIFLPSGGSFDTLKRYGLTLSPDGRRLYATNPAIGVVAEIDLATRKVVRTTRFPATRDLTGSTELTGTISRNGRTLYFSPGRDLWAFDAAYGVVRGPYRTGGRVSGFGFGAGDQRVVALRADGRLLSFAAATGKRLSAGP